jgi:hypothetical protein
VSAVLVGYANGLGAFFYKVASSCLKSLVCHLVVWLVVFGIDGLGFVAILWIGL